MTDFYEKKFDEANKEGTHLRELLQKANQLLIFYADPKNYDEGQRARDYLKDFGY